MVELDLSVHLRIESTGVPKIGNFLDTVVNPMLRTLAIVSPVGLKPYPANFPQLFSLLGLTNYSEVTKNTEKLVGHGLLSCSESLVF